MKTTDDININVGRILNIAPKRTFEEFYSIIENLDNKAFGTYYLVEEIKTSKKKVAYVIKKEKVSNKNLTEKNKSQLLELNHVNMTLIFDFLEDANNIYIILEYCPGGNLLTYLLKNKLFNENNVKIIIKQLLDAVNYLHNQTPPIIIGDLELSHIYIYEETENLNSAIIKLSDFINCFLGKKLGVVQKHYYVAPEIIKGEEKTFRSDIWSIGAIAYTLLIGEPPFNGKEHEIIFKVYNVLNR